jgi:hypothetical protein
MKLYNTDNSPVVVGGWNNPAVFPGEARDFDADTAAYLLSTGRWSEADPRAGLKAELAFKANRDKPTDEKEDS